MKRYYLGKECNRKNAWSEFKISGIKRVSWPQNFLWSLTIPVWLGKDDADPVNSIFQKNHPKPFSHKASPSRSGLGRVWEMLSSASSYTFIKSSSGSVKNLSLHSNITLWKAFPFQKHSFSTIYMTDPESTKVGMSQSLLSKTLFSTWALVSPRVLRQPVLELTNTPVKRKKKQIPRFEPKPTDSNFLACEVTQSCPTLCDPMDCSLPGSSVHEIFQARVLEWVAISFSRASSQPRDQTRISHSTGRRFTSNFLRGLIFISKRFW